MTPPIVGSDIDTSGYRSRVTAGLLYDTVKLLEAAGGRWAGEDPERRADALVALCELADAVAGPSPR